MALLEKLLDPKKGLFAPTETDLAPIVAQKVEAVRQIRVPSRRQG